MKMRYEQHRLHPRLVHPRRAKNRKIMKALELLLFLPRKYRDWRDRKFRQRIDRVYFHVDEHGNRFMLGAFHAVKDEETGAGGILCCNPGMTMEEAKAELKTLRVQRSDGEGGGD